MCALKILRSLNGALVETYVCSVALSSLRLALKKPSSCKNSVDGKSVIPQWELSRMPSARLAIYIDGANMEHSAEELGFRIDYTRFKKFLVGTRTLAFVNYYNGYSTDVGRQVFYHKLETFGFSVELGPPRQVGLPQKQVDVQIAVDAISNAYDNLFDVALIASGDGDLTPAVKKLKSMIKPVEIASFRDQLSSYLLTNATRIIDLSANVNVIKWV